MQPQKLAESQGIRLLRQLFLRGKRIFNMQDAKMVATLEKIPHNQLKKILSNLAKHGRAIKFIAILINCATLKLWEELGGFMNTIRFGRYVATPFTDIHSKLIFECQEITESYVPMELSLFLSIAKNWLASHFGYVVLNYNSVIIRMDNHKELFEIFKDHEVTIRSNEDFNLNKMNVNAMQKELGLNK